MISWEIWIGGLCVLCEKVIYCILDCHVIRCTHSSQWRGKVILRRSRRIYYITRCWIKSSMTEIYFYYITMALYSGLPIFKTSYDLLIYLFQVTKTFPKEYKYTLGEKMKTELLDLIVVIFHANRSTDKVLLLDQVQTHIETVRILMRITHDLKIIATKQFAHTALLIDSVSKQVTWWKNYCR